MDKKYTEATYYINSDSESIIEYTSQIIKDAANDLDKGIKIFYAVRDDIKYNPYILTFNKSDYIASNVLAKKEGFCIQKAILLTACARAAGIPSRLNFVNVINHLATENLKNLMKTDLFVFHGCTELYLEGKWVKATPAFNISLCDRFGVKPLDFDGKNNSLFHPFDKSGRKHMEYVHDYGDFDDFPFDMMMEEFQKFYPHWFKDDHKGLYRMGDFEKEASLENK